MEDRCVCCGRIIPEGSHVCPNCRVYVKPTVDAIPVAEIKAYLQSKLDEWDALGDRKFEPANMWGYNFIMACFDDLGRR